MTGVTVLAAENYPDRYPEPEVIYQDPELIEKLTPQKGAEPEKRERYPAAYNKPQVIYQDPELIEKVGPLIPVGEGAGQAEERSPTWLQVRSMNPGLERPSASLPQDRSPIETEKATPPYGLLLLLFALIAFLFWQRPRPEPVEPSEAEGGDPRPEAGSGGQSDDDLPGSGPKEEVEEESATGSEGETPRP